MSQKKWPDWFMYMTDASDGNVRGWKVDPGPQGHWIFQDERCTFEKMEVLNSDSYNKPILQGTQVIGVVTSGSCIGKGPHKINLESVDSVVETVGVTTSETNEVNYQITTSMEVDGSLKPFVLGGSVKVGVSTSVGGSHSWTTAESKDFSTGNNVGVGHSTFYDGPGVAMLIGTSDRYTFENPNVAVMKYFTCPSGAKFQKKSTIELRTSTYQAAHFEAMTRK